MALVLLMFAANIGGFVNSLLTYLNAELAYSDKTTLIIQQVFFYVEMLSANLLYWTYAANYWSLSMRLQILANQDGSAARNFERKIYCVNTMVIVANLAIVLVWQICYYFWCTTYLNLTTISTLYKVVWSIYIAMDLVSLFTLCYALHSIKNTLKIRQEKTLNTWMVTSLIVVYMIYISH